VHRTWSHFIKQTIVLYDYNEGDTYKCETVQLHNGCCQEKNNMQECRKQSIVLDARDSAKAFRARAG
jgi:hypothetical protein